MDDRELGEELHQQLLDHRQRLEDEISNLGGGGARADVFQENESDAVDQHPADEGSELFEREKNLTLQRAVEANLEAVNEALKRYDAGTYGRCMHCGKPIPQARLKALPEAAYDIECQSKFERGQLIPGR